MSKPPLVTSASAPDVEQVREWLERMIGLARFADIVCAVIALITRLRDLNTDLTKQLSDLRRARPKSETLKRLEGQLSFSFAEPFEQPAQEASANREGKPRKSRKGRHPGRQRLAEHLPRVLKPNPLPDELRVCPKCGSRDLKHLGQLAQGSEVLNVVPARIFVEVRVDEVLICPVDGAIVSAPPPPRIVEKGVLGDELIVESTLDKFLEHRPTERQCTRFRRQGASIAPQTLGRSMGAHADLLAPVADLIRAKTRGPGLLGTDASSIAVLDPKASGGIRAGSMWVWTNALWVSFSYSVRCDSDAVKDFLGEDQARTVQCDGANVFTFIERAGGKRPGCWAHGRRRLVQAARAGDRLGLEGVHKIAPLFRIERTSKLAGDNAVQRLD